MKDLVAFIDSRLDEDEKAAQLSGRGRVAWLTYRDDEGQMLYTTVAASDDFSPWFADGHELPEPASADNIYDQARALREVAAKRDIVRRCWAHMNELDTYPSDLVSPRAVLARTVLVALATAWNDHPEYRQEWKP